MGRRKRPLKTRALVGALLFWASAGEGDAAWSPMAVGSILGVGNTGREIPQEQSQQGRREVRLELCWELGSP